MPDGPDPGRAGQQASEELGKQLIEVIELFERAADVYERGGLKHQQEGVALAAEAAYVLVYLLGQRHGELLGERIAKPLAHLAAELGNHLYGIHSPLLDGFRSPLLKPLKYGSGRRPAPLQERALWVCAAVAMELLITARRESSERESADAAGEVADRLKAHGVQLGGGLTFGAQTVEHWRERVKREEPLRRWYDRMLEGAKRLDSDPERAAHGMIHGFFQTVPQTAKS